VPSSAGSAERFSLPSREVKTALRRVRWLEQQHDVAALASELEDPFFIGGGEMSRAAAARALGRMGDSTAGSQLVAVLDDPSDSLRHAAVRALIDIGYRDSAERLVPRLDDSYRPVRLAAARGLGLFRYSEAREALRRALESDDPWLRLNAAEALAAIGESDLRPVVADALVRERWRFLGGRRRRWRRLLSGLQD